MTGHLKLKVSGALKRFNRGGFEAVEDFTYIGSGSIGGKALGLLAIKDHIDGGIDRQAYSNILVNIPRSTVITTELFDIFMERNDLYEVSYGSSESDSYIAHSFQKANLPVELLGDLRALVSKIHTPLAIRSSSLIEDSIDEPFAGIYATKMIPNNQSDVDTRFKKLVEAIKLVYATTFFKSAKDYFASIKRDQKEEKMAVIIQECVGARYDDYYYPTISGVARSYNCYPSGHAGPNDGVVCLALGLGKTVVDGGLCWRYCPAYPEMPPPCGSVRDLLKQTQTKFWAVNMGLIREYDPIEETEYLIQSGLKVAEYHDTLNYIASTYDAASDRLCMGANTCGPRLLNFSRILTMDDIRLNSLIQDILSICEEKFESAVEIEFAATIDVNGKEPTRFALLQVRPMAVSAEEVHIDPSELDAGSALVASDSVLGNGSIEDICDIVFVRPELFDKSATREIATQIGEINKKLLDEKRPYLLIGFGRWGSSEPWLGIPVDWGQVSGASAIVESTLPEMTVEMSQGSHFFHNLISFHVSYFTLRHGDRYNIDWKWLEKQHCETETTYVKHVKTSRPLKIKVDGRKGIGVILR